MYSEVGLKIWLYQGGGEKKGCSQTNLYGAKCETREGLVTARDLEDVGMRNLN